MENEAVSLLQNAPPRPFITGAPNHRPFQKRFRDWNELATQSRLGLLPGTLVVYLLLKRLKVFAKYA